MSRRLAKLAGLAALGLLAPAQVQAARPAAAQQDQGAIIRRATPPSPAPAFKAGATVVDRNGVAVGVIESVVEGPTEMMVVVKIDGKLVSVPQSTLRLNGRVVVSSQTKAVMLAAAGAAG